MESIVSTVFIFNTISIIGMNEIIYNTTNQNTNNNTKKYNNSCIPKNTVIKNPDSKNCRNIVWILTYLYSPKFCNNLCNFLKYCEEQNLTNTNAFKILNIINNLKNDINTKNINKNKEEYIYDNFSNFIQITEDTNIYFNKIIYFYYILYLKEIYKTDKIKLEEEIKKFFLTNVTITNYKYLIKMNKEEQYFYNDNVNKYDYCDNIEDQDNICKSLINKYITPKYIENINTFNKELIENNLGSFINKDKIILPSIINGNVIFSDHPYDSYVINIFINLIFNNIKKDFAFKTFFNGVGIFDNDDLIISEYPILFNDNYNLKYVHTFFHPNSTVHYNLISLDENKLIENYSKSNKYLKNFEISRTNTVIGAYIYEKTQNYNHNTLNYYNLYRFFNTYNKKENYEKNINKCNDFFDNIKNYKKKMNIDSDNKIESLNNATTDLKNNFLKIFKKFNKPNKEKFIILNSYFAHKLVSEDIYECNIEYIKKLLEILNLNNKD